MTILHCKVGLSLLCGCGIPGHIHLLYYRYSFLFNFDNRPGVRLNYIKPFIAFLLSDRYMSQGAEKSQPPEVGMEPGPQDLKANTLPRRCKSRLLPQGSRSVLYLPIPTTYFPALN